MKSIFPTCEAFGVIPQWTKPRPCTQSSWNDCSFSRALLIVSFPDLSVRLCASLGITPRCYAPGTRLNFLLFSTIFHA